MLAIGFPIIAITGGNDLNYARNEDEITICTKTALHNNFFKGLKIIDSEGRCYIVKNAKKTGTIGAFWGYNIFLNQKLKVELDFVDQDIRIFDLGDLKTCILKAFKKYEYFWNADGELNERIEFVKTAASHRELIHRLTSDFYHTVQT